MTLNSEVNSVWKNKERWKMLVRREPYHGKLKPKQNLCVLSFLFFLRSRKYLLEILSCLVVSYMSQFL